MENREAFEKWFQGEMMGDRIYGADEDGAWSAWQASRRAALDEAAEIAHQYEEGSGGADAIRALKVENA